MSTFPKNILLCLFLVPNIAFARGGEFPLIFVFIIYGGLLLIPIGVFLYSCRSVNKNRGAGIDKTLHILLSIILFFVIFWLFMYLWEHIYYSFLYNTLDIWTNGHKYKITYPLFALLTLIAAYFSPKIAHKIIK